MFDHAADVPEAGVRQTGVLVAGEEWLAVLPQRLVAVHARAVIAEVGLRHEGRGLAVGGGDVVDDVFVELHPVRHGQQIRELQTQLMLSRRHFVVVLFRLEAEFAHHRQHFAAQILSGVDRVDREVAALRARTVSHVAFRIFATCIERQLRAVELVAHLGRVRVPTDVVKHEELGFRSEIDLIAGARRLHIGEGLLGDGTGVAVVRLTGVRVQHVAEQEHRGLLIERVDIGGLEVRTQQHVGLVDRLPSGDGRAVEHGALGQEVVVDKSDIEGHMLHLAPDVGEPDINVLDVLVLDFLEDFGWRHRMGS